MILASDNNDYIRFDPDTVGMQSGNTAPMNVKTAAVLRDPSAWYHLVFALDTTQATASDRFKIYINGTQATDFSATTYPALNAEFNINNTTTQYLGRRFSPAEQYFDGYMAEVNFIDGTALDADSFGELKNGVWIPKNPSGLTYGTNGFRLSFADDAEVEAFNTITWRGDGSGTFKPRTGVGFSPDLVWIKNRNGSNHHLLFDSVRGAGSNKELSSNNTTAEGGLSLSGYDWLSSFDSDGLTTQWSGSNIPYYTNQNGYGYVAWCWDAGANYTPTGHSSVTYTGNSGTQKISGMGFQPDLVWIKARNTSSFYHHISDSVRGFDKYLFPNVTLAEETNTTRVISTTNDGMILGNKNDTNTGYNYVAWGWDAGDGDPVSNTDGSITSTVKASAANGFSIVSYIGTGANATIGHGLGATPDWIIVKNRDRSANWIVWHNALNQNQILELSTTAAVQTDNIFWNNTLPTSTVFSVAGPGDNSTNASGEDIIAYCFSEVSGASKFGTYTGNGSATGPSITTGFRVGWLMVKRTDANEEWVIYDASRDPFNPNSKQLNANRSDAEYDRAAANVDFNSDGFQIKTSDGWVNANGGTYIYAAFAGSYSDYITDYNTDGSIDSRVKANDTTGFSIVSTENHTGSQTVGHGLSSAPDWIVAKARTGALIWPVYHSALGNTKRLRLNDTTAAETNAVWGNTDPTTSVFTFHQSSNTYDYIFYCWAEKAGYSKFGSYTGGTANYKVTTDFRPSLVLVKRTDSTSDWQMFDGTRDVSNPVTARLNPNQSYAELTNGNFDILDDGFELNDTSAGWNASGGTYIYAAFADTREAAFWLDQSGNDNDWQPVNLDHNDTVADSPTDNFCTMNPLAPPSNTNNALSDGNLVVTATAASWSHAPATWGLQSGQWYWEVTTLTDSAFVGMSSPAVANLSANALMGWDDPLKDAYIYQADASSGMVRHNGSTIVSSKLGTPAGTVIGLAVDIDAGTLKFYVNNELQYTASDDFTGWFPDAAVINSVAYRYNFGQQPFKYDPPA
jgi:hypothetical protein